MEETIGYIGTYASEQSKGVYHFTLNMDSGAMEGPELLIEAADAKWVSLSAQRLVFPVKKDGRAGVCVLERKAKGWQPAGEVLEELDTPCYILQDKEYVFSANYHQGVVMVYTVGGGKLTVCKRIEAGAQAGCHQILLHENYLLAPCLTQHCMRLYDREHGYDPAGKILFPDGSGPRHGVFNRKHTRLYMVSEWSNELFVFSVSGQSFELICQTPVLEGHVRDAGREDIDNGHAACAAIRITKEERFAYISVRGLDLIAVFRVEDDKITPVQYVPCAGEHPRDFILTKDERFVLVANRHRGGIVSIARDPVSGKLSEVAGRIPMPQGVSLCLEDRDMKMLTGFDRAERRE